ncbi:ABATE domain-containing protein [Granulicella sp. dw_53]|uniref:CGNR zinc finger domain-containing protein n=1 Tax=Granulicella sp. dw_53 TaxID=2719792 RepID=UPI001BD47C37|nr:ABATE domain-containing protein [Granulicella sp. dw_53]
MQNKRQPSTQQEPILLADHPALDLLNTLPNVNGKLVDLFQTDADVVHWLVRAELTPPATRPPAPPSSLLNAARTLRETFRRLLQKYKADERGDLTAINAFLTEAQSHPQLVWDRSRSLKVARVRQQTTPEQILAPLAEIAADLLVTGDMDLVKRCEDETCVLWFYDQTKSHHRRWCSMATCGNRHKVAAYRRRNLEREI